jgi:hypothetical protein
MRRAVHLVCLAAFFLALLALPLGASAVLLTYGFSGTVSVLSPYDDYNVLLGQVQSGETEVSGTFRVDTAALDADPDLNRGLYHFDVDANALVANVGVLTFRNDAIQIAVSDDRLRAGQPVDSMTVFAAGAADPVVWTAYGYQLHVNTLAVEIFDSNTYAIALLDPIAALPPLEALGPNALGQLYVEGCRLVGGETECGATHRFRIQADVDDIFLVPETATGALLLFGLAALAARRREARTPER